MKAIFSLFILMAAIASAHTVHAGVDVDDYVKRFAHPRMTHGDFDGDGSLDLVVGRPNGGSNMPYHLGGELFIYMGNSHRSPILSIYDNFFPWDDATPPYVVDYDHRKTLHEILSVRRNSFFGSSLAVGDYNDDGVEDLAVGAPGAAVGPIAHAGQVLVFWGGASPLAEHTAINQDRPQVTSRAEPGDFFGHALQTGDFNCDGIDDLAVGVPFEDYDRSEDAGYVHVFYGRSGSVDLDRHSHWQKFFQRQFEGVRERSHELFGFSLAAGQFSRQAVWQNCEDLAIGAPGDYGSRGRVFVYHQAANQPEAYLNNSDLKEVLTQSTEGLQGPPEWGDRFGEILGKLDDSAFRNFDHLYVGSPGDSGPDNGATSHPMRQPPLGCNDLGRVPYEVIKSHNGGFMRSDGSVSATHYCGFFPPDLFERKRGVVHEFKTALGGVSFYIPQNFTGRYTRPSPVRPARAVLLIHGRPAGSGDANACSATGNRLLRATTTTPSALTHHFRWQEVADDTGHVLVSPAIWGQYFATQSTCTGMGGRLSDFGYGFEGLIGSDGTRPYMLFQYLLDIMDDLKHVGLNTTRFRVYGHSGGGRALTRFLWLFPLRMERVLISAPGSYLNNLPNAAWPEGLGELAQWMRFRGWTRDQLVHFDPGQATQGMSLRQWWQNAVLNRPIDVVVGEDETLMKHYMASTWVDVFNDLVATNPIGLCAVDGCGHSSRCMSEVSANRLLRSSGRVGGPEWDMSALCTPAFPSLFRAHCDVVNTVGGDLWSWDNAGEGNCTDMLDNDCDGNGFTNIDGNDPEDCP